MKEIKYEEIVSIDINNYMDLLKEPFPVYGDFLRYFTIKLGDLPLEMSTSLLRVGDFYEVLRTIANNMFEAYVRFAFLKADYVLLEDFEFANKAKGDPIHLTEEIIEALLDGSREPKFFEEGFYHFINLKSNEDIIVVLFRLQPFITSKKAIIFGMSPENRAEWLLYMLDFKFKISENNLPCLIIVDPFTYRLAKNYIKIFKQKIEDKLGPNTVLSCYELLSFLALDRESFEEDWKTLRDQAIRMLKEDYKFLSLHDKIWRLHEARREFEEAKAILLKSELTESDCKQIIWRTSKAVESILGIMYHIFKNIQPLEKTFGQMLNELRTEIIDEFDEDVFRDLDFIREWRNAVDHSKPVRVSKVDAIKVFKKAELFFDIFLMKMDLRGE